MLAAAGVGVVAVARREASASRTQPLYVYVYVWLARQPVKREANCVELVARAWNKGESNVVIYIYVCVCVLRYLLMPTQRRLAAR